MNDLLHSLSRFVSETLPNPPAAAPPGLDAKIALLIGLCKTISLAAISASVMLAGTLVMVGSGHGQDRISQRMQERISWALIAGVIVSIGTGAVGWLM